MPVKVESLTTAIIKRTHRVPVTVQSPNGEYPSSEALSRQLDVALISVGFKASPTLIKYVSNLSPVGAKEVSDEVLKAAKEIKGSHVSHNTYFKEFPKNVPDTIEFWTELIEQTYGSTEEAPLFINLLDLDGYGKYLHTYEEMVEAHEPFVAKNVQKLTVLNLGKSLEDECLALYTSLAESKVPANEDDRVLLIRLAEVCIDYKQPVKIPVRENKAIINAVRVEFGVPILADTVTDVLRLAVQLSGGDVTLQTKPKFRSIPFKTRKLLLDAFDEIAQNEAKLGDVYKHREAIKRLFMRLNTSSRYEHAYKVLEYAVNGYNTSFESKLEKAFATGDIDEVVAVLQNNPGLFVRSLNRLLLQSKIKDIPTVTSALEKVAGKVSTPVLVGLRQYLGNRKVQKTYRVFMNRKGTGKVVEDTQPILGAELLNPIVELIDQEVLSRLPEGAFVISRDMLNVALPLSNKQTADGFGTMPRGSVDSLSTEVLRFFTYWKEQKHTTDFDLSAIMLDEDFKQVSQLSYTQLSAVGGVHSGDITSAPDGASEFIDIETAKVKAKYVVPQVNVYGGEGFDEVEESFFGYMERSLDQKGKPFEPLTVKTKAEMRGNQRVALPLIFINEGGSWTVKWLNAFLKGYSWGNQTENNALSTSTMVRSVVETNYLTVSYLVDLLFKSAHGDRKRVVYFEDELAGKEDFEGLVESKASCYYIAREVPDFVNDTDVKTITLKNLHELLF